MMKTFLLTYGTPTSLFRKNFKSFSTSFTRNKSYKLVVVGGGAGGCSTAAKFSSKLGKGKVAVIEPASTHYYQPLWTLVGGGMKTLEQTARPMKDVLPAKADWIQQRVTGFKPDENKVVCENGDDISYDFLVIAMGIQLHYDKVKGLLEALETPGVGSNYSPLHVNKTYKGLKEFKGGNAVFTFPDCQIKCPGAPQKIMYIFEDLQRRKGIQFKTDITYNTALPVLFFSKYYADVLWDVARSRSIAVNLRHNLVEVKPDSREAIFQNLDKPEELTSFPYDFLHVTPPMASPDPLKNEEKLVDETGFLNINKETLQHVKYANIFGIGDCTNIPIPKTAAAVAGQLKVLKKNLTKALDGQPMSNAYDGYTSCPLVTGYSKCILSEFDFSKNPLETFPIDQRKERRTMFYLKKDLLPFIYWNGMLKGYWEGPRTFRKIFHLGFK